LALEILKRFWGKTFCGHISCSAVHGFVYCLFFSRQEHNESFVTCPSLHSAGQLARTGLVVVEVLETAVFQGAMPPQQQWKKSPLALTATAAMMCLYLGAPQTLPSPQNTPVEQ
jgi:hypothetical protein